MSAVEGDDKVPWQQMSILRLLSTLGGLTALVAVLIYITCSSATGLELLLSVFIAWIAFAVVMSLGGITALLIMFVAEILMVFVQDDDTKGRVFLGLRWLAFLVGAGALLWMGGRGVYDGMENNRLAEPQVLYERCMAPQTRTVQDRWQECSDGWGSSSIGRRGACSHHGGVVWRMVERKERYQPHDAGFCRTDTAARSWVD